MGGVYVTEIDGESASVEDLSPLAFAGYGHYTAMQVRDHRVRGLDLHLARLVESSEELFGTAVDPDDVRHHLRHAVQSGDGDVSAIVNVFSPDGPRVRAGAAVAPHVLVRTSPPIDPDPAPLRARTATHVRPLAHLKHLDTMALTLLPRRTSGGGYHDVVFLDDDGFVSEGSIWNVAFFDGRHVLWPNAPALRGITMQLVQEGMRHEGVPFRTTAVHVSELATMRAAVFMNSTTPAQPLGCIDDVVFDDDPELLTTLRRAYETNEPQAI